MHNLYEKSSDFLHNHKVMPFKFMSFWYSLLAVKCNLLIQVGQNTAGTKGKYL